MRKEKSFNSLRNTLLLALAINNLETVLNAKDAISTAYEHNCHQVSDTALVLLLCASRIPSFPADASAWMKR
jgi:hypothetical protein